jgi:hypothetical protein
MKEVMIVKYLDLEDDEPKDVYEMDDAQRFFDFVQRNYSPGAKMEIEYKEITDEEWDEMVKIGEEMA